jgi:L-ribulose-5-phosphate 3-epimerase
MSDARVGFMQGRLSPLFDGKIQAFPWTHWEAEFDLARSIGLSCMEWTLDQYRIGENPLMTAHGRDYIRRLSSESGIRIPSLTGDCFMQAPFWKASGDQFAGLVATFREVLLACADAGIGIVVIPLVDNGALANDGERALLEKTLLGLTAVLREHGLVVVFESDFPPARLLGFISGLPEDCFGINFDMGNSASLGWDPAQEIPLLGSRIMNVHVKDRELGGPSVPLGHGATDFPRVFELLNAAGYSGDYILQTARAADGQHVETIRRYRDFVSQQIGETHGS